MTQEFKIYLNLFSKYLTQTLGCEDARFSGDWYGLNIHHNSFDSCKGTDRSPIPIENLIDQWLDENSTEIRENQEGEDPYALDVIINGKDRTIAVFEQYSEYSTDDTETTTIDTDSEPELKEIIKYFCEEKEMCRGNITWQFNGGGDSGYIETETGYSDFFGSRISMTTQLEEMSYRMLEEYGGWEINEGSLGEFVLDLDLEEYTLNFNWNVETTVEHEVLKMKF